MGNHHSRAKVPGNQQMPGSHHFAAGHHLGSTGKATRTVETKPDKLRNNRSDTNRSRTSLNANVGDVDTKESVQESLSEALCDDLGTPDDFQLRHKDKQNQGYLEFIHTKINILDYGSDPPAWKSLDMGILDQPYLISGQTYRIRGLLQLTQKCKVNRISGLRQFVQYYNNEDMEVRHNDLETRSTQKFKVGDIMPPQCEKSFHMVNVYEHEIVFGETCQIDFAYEIPNLKSGKISREVVVVDPVSRLVLIDFWEDIMILSARDFVNMHRIQDERLDRDAKLLQTATSPFAHMAEECKSEDYIATMQRVAKRQFKYMDATDGVPLSGRTFFPLGGKGKSLDAMILHYTGFIIPSESHDYMLEKLCSEYNVFISNIDTRGTGRSGGKSGDTPSTTQMLRDIRTHVRSLRWSRSPGQEAAVPIFLMGFWGAGGLLMNYSNWKDRDPVDGYIFYGATFGRWINVFPDNGLEDFRALVDLRTPKPRHILPAVLGMNWHTNKAFSVKLGTTLDESKTAKQHDEHHVTGFSLEYGASFSANKKSFAGIDRPCAFFIPGKSKMIDPQKYIKKMRKYVKQEITYSGRTYQTHMEVIDNCDIFMMCTHTYKQIGDWIRKTNVDRTALDFDVFSYKEQSLSRQKHHSFRRTTRSASGTLSTIPSLGRSLSEIDLSSAEGSSEEVEQMHGGLGSKDVQVLQQNLNFDLPIARALEGLQGVQLIFFIYYHSTLQEVADSAKRRSASRTSLGSHSSLDQTQSQTSRAGATHSDGNSSATTSPGTGSRPASAHHDHTGTGKSSNNGTQTDPLASQARSSSASASITSSALASGHSVGSLMASGTNSSQSQGRTMPAGPSVSVSVTLPEDECRNCHMTLEEIEKKEVEARAQVDDTYDTSSMGSVSSDDSSLDVDIQKSVRSVGAIPHEITMQPTIDGPENKLSDFITRENHEHLNTQPPMGGVLPHQTCMIVLGSFGCHILARELARIGKGDIISYVFYPRGCGKSSELKEDNTEEHPLADLRSFIRRIKQIRGTETPVILCGFALLSSVVLNYASWSKREEVDGYFLVSPWFGKTKSGQDSLVKVNQIGKGLLKGLGRIRGNGLALEFGSDLKKMLDKYEPMFPSAKGVQSIYLKLMLYDLDKDFKQFDKPFCVIMGEDDEFVDVPVVLAGLKGAKKVHASRKHIEVVPGETMFSVQLKIDSMLPWLYDLVKSGVQPEPGIKLGPDTSLKDFAIMNLIGRGGFAQVRLVQHKQTEKYFALKIMEKKAMIEMDAVENVVAEKNIMQKVSHPLIVNLSASFKDPSYAYLVMDFLVGGELFTLIKLSRRFSETITRFYIGEIILGLEYLHTQHIMYRDLKPENILIDQRGHVRICDFGFAKQMDSRDQRTQTFCGTPEYLAPEILDNLGGYTRHVDLWALGVVAFECLTGRMPFSAKGDLLYIHILEEEPEYPSYVSATAKSFVSGLMTKSMRDRLDFGFDGSGLVRPKPQNKSKRTVGKRSSMNRHGYTVRTHPFWDDFEWTKLETFSMAAPFTPSFRDFADTNNFITYDDDSNNDVSFMMGENQQQSFTPSQRGYTLKDVNVAGKKRFSTDTSEMEKLFKDF